MSLVPRSYFGDIFDDFMPRVKEEHMKCDIYEKDGDYHIEMDVPGFDKKEIKIEAKNDYLTITAEKNNEVNEEDKEKNYIHRERSYGKFQRSFYLQDLDGDKVSAEFNNGVLKIVVPKKDENEDKKYIEIK
ncbi:MAG: Hsp20/alpha crystallin family protein [Bacilli bacterium]|nr:Hsp20/alpha crystallin family protein [Bacilli bacterium]